MTSGNYDNDFPSSCDVLCLGTGLVESIVGAACSRIGKKVVVLDRNPYYGGDWATFNVKGIQEWFANYLAGDQKLIYKDFNEGLKSEELLLDVPLKRSLSISDASLCDYTNGIEADKIIGDGSTKQHEVTSTGDLTEDESSVSDQADDVTETKLKLVTLFRKYGRQFNIALCSKILLARGKMVRLLVDSATSRYCEFLAVNDINFFNDGELQKVPSCRADVFKNSLITLPEKRQMMRLLEFCFDESNTLSADECGKSFVDYLRETHGISDRLAKIITLHILYENCDAATPVCFSKLRMFCKSLGVYSKSPYLWTMYGVGELPQCFSRLNAIFGGTFILGAEEQMPCKIVVETKDQFDGDADEGSSKLKSTSVSGVLLTSGQRITCEYLIAETSYVPTSVLPVFEMPAKKFLRAIFITSRRLEPTRESSISLISIPPPEGRKYPLKLVEEAPSSSSTPEPFYMLQATVEDEEEEMDPQSQIDLYMHQILQPFSMKTKFGNGESGKRDVPEVLLALYFRCKYRPTTLDALPHKDSCSDVAETSSSFLNNLFVCSGPDAELDFEACVQQAEEIFKRMYPAEDFLPKAPDPSDVIIGGDSCEVVTDESGLEDSHCTTDGNINEQSESATCGAPVETGDKTASDETFAKEDPANRDDQKRN